MKTQKYQNRWTPRLSAALVAVLVATAIVSVGPAFADEGVDPRVQARAAKIDERLEACFERQNEWYEFQEANITKAHNAIARIQDALARAAERGVDTSAMEAQLPGLYAAVDQAQVAHALADQILSEHAGFNGGGKVKDRQQALETCKSARDALASGRTSLQTARAIVGEIIQLVKELRGSYGPTPELAG